MPEPSPFPEFFINGMLREAKWPREAGLFKKKWVVDARMVDFTCLQLTELAVTLGATRPLLAAQLLADLFRERDWQARPLGELLTDLDPTARVVAAPGRAPWHAIATFRLAPNGDLLKEQLIPWELLAHRNFRTEATVACAAGLVWGLLHPADAVEAIDREAARLNNNIPAMKKAGLELDLGFTTPSAEEAGNNAEEMLTSYQAECRALVPLPKALADSPEIRGRFGI